MTFRLSEDAGIGRVALRVADADEAADFYERALGLARLGGDAGNGRGRGDGDAGDEGIHGESDAGGGRIHDEGDAGEGRIRREGDDPGGSAGDGRTRWLGTGDGDPLLGLVEAPGAPTRADDEAGLFHVALRVPTRQALAEGVARMRAAGARLTGASDHLVSEAVYLSDPEGNGLELYRDRPREKWEETPDGGVRMATLPLDLEDLLAGVGDPPERIHPGADVGHVHLEPTDLARSVGFYRDELGTNLQARMGSAAAFLAAGGYHHHVGLNRWNERSTPAGDDTLGLAWFELVVPEGDYERLRERLDGHRTGDERRTGETGDDGFEVRDPDGIRIRISPR